MKISSFAVQVQFVFFPLLIVPTGVSAGSSSSAESAQHDLHSAESVTAVVLSEEDVLASARADPTIPDIIPRVLKKKRKKKKPKGGKVSKSAKILASPSSPPTSQDSSHPTVSFQPSSQPSVSSQPTDPCAPITTAKDAILALRDGFDNGDTVLTDWDIDTDPCTGDTSNWSYITCANGEVTEIKFWQVTGSLGLEGTISPLIGCPTTLVSNLTHLWFNNNKLTGTIPTELGELTSLIELDFHTNSLSASTMPPELCVLRDDASPPGPLEFLCADDQTAPAVVTCDCCYYCD